MRISDWSSDVCSADLSAMTAPVFLVSFRYRREAQAAIEATGRSVIVNQRPEDAARRYASSEALIAVVHARGALPRGIAQVRPEELRVGTESVSTFSSRWSPSPSKKNNYKFFTS